MVSFTSESNFWSSVLRVDCPFGTIQEFIGKLGKKLFPKRYNRLIIPSVDYWLRYIVLIMVMIVTARAFTIVFLILIPILHYLISSQRRLPFLFS